MDAVAVTDRLDGDGGQAIQAATRFSVTPHELAQRTKGYTVRALEV